MVEDNDLIFPLLRGYKGNTIESAIGSKNSMLNAYLKEIIAARGIEKNISMHCARHSFAVNSLAMGADIYVLSKCLGHLSMTATLIYSKAVDKRKDELTNLWN
jgi:site-specific recombinase XerD